MIEPVCTFSVAGGKIQFTDESFAKVEEPRKKAILATIDSLKAQL
jgi:hypothetical protein